ncbi:hypothetical protein F5B20DRAFT_144474 [Whalleya microplaca]|nr:hypothetical protein F5B20DRAFT_144474 [Whalleya microplaca]
MADNMCGPSNAFKGLAQHVDQDRSLQQDRFVSGSQGFGQSFHSTQPGNGAAGQSFSAFQGGNAALPDFHSAGPSLPVHGPAYHQHQSGFHGPGPGFPAQHAAPMPDAGADWANDFRQLSLNGQAPHTSLSPMMQPASFPAYAPGHMRPPYHFPFAHMKESPVYMSPPPYGDSFNQIHYPPPQELQNSISPMVPADPATLDADFEAEMQAWMSVNGPQAEAEAGAQFDHVEDVAATEEQATALPAEANALLVEDAIPITEEAQEAQSQQQSETELARAAQQLIDSVSDNSTEKFRHSSFLALMRRIAAKELVVQGNDLVQPSQTSASDPDPDVGSGSHITGRTSAASPRQVCIFS